MIYKIIYNFFFFKVKKKSHMSLLNTSVKVWVKEKKPIIDKDIEKRLKPLMEAYNLDASAFI